MKAPSILTASLTASSALAALLVANVASADCLTDGCAKGFTCEAGPMVDCPPQPACPPGQDCPTSNMKCEPVTYYSCVPAPCATDADCAADMVCYTSTITSTCTSPACPPNADCPPPPPCDPQTTVVSQCLPKYAVPCHVDNDCGAGFTCVQDEVCYGGGGVATPGSSGSAGGSAGTGASSGSPGMEPAPTPDPLPPVCNVVGTSHCEAKPTVCTTDANCPADWKCVQTYSGGGTACSGGAPADPGGGTAGSAPVPPEETCVTTPSQPGPSYCMPPYYDVAVPQAAKDGNAGGPTGSGGSGETFGTNAGLPSTSDHSSTNGGTNVRAANGASQDDGGCQVALGHGSSGGAGLLAVLGMLGLVRKRRAKAA